MAAKVDQKDISLVLKYIDSYWPKIVRENKKDTGTLIGLPNPFIIPCTKMFEEQYYWDSYPVIKALIDDPTYGKIALGMVDNLLYEVERFGFVPNASRMYYLSRSQPPFLSEMVWDVFNSTKNLAWFRRAIKLVETEYQNVWASKEHPHHRNVHKGLSRYYDLNISDELAMAESGWDNTVRFEEGCLNILPVDLNCLLYVYEQDMSKAFGLLEEYKKEEKYKKLARDRAKTINELMLNDKTGFYFDYNFVNKKQLKVITVAGLFPLAVGIASTDQASRSLKIIEGVLEEAGGIVQSEKFERGLQWDWPNGWPIQQLKTVEGLIRYGYKKEAKRIIEKWLNLNIKVFKETGEMWEKYDVVNLKIGVPDRYPTQSGFGWTNACFLILAKILFDLEDEQMQSDKDTEFIRPSIFTS